VKVKKRVFLFIVFFFNIFISHSQSQSICEAALNDDWTLVKSLVDSGVDVNTVCYQKQMGKPFRLLEEAVLSKNLDIVRFLVEKGANTNSNETYNPLYFASGNGDLQMVKYFAEELKMKIDTANIIQAACFSPGIEVFKYFIEERKLAIDTINVVKMCSYGSLEKLEYLKSRYKIKIAEISINHDNILISYINSKYSQRIDTNFVKFCISQGIDINSKDKNGNNSLMLCVKNATIDDVNYFIRNGIDLHCRNSEGKNVIDFCNPQNGHYKKIKTLLVEKGLIDPYVLFDALDERNIELIPALVKAGVDLNLIDYRGHTCLEMACQQGEFEVVKLLVESGADINMKLQSNRTLLMYALQRCNYDCVEYLINKGVKTNVADDYGKLDMFFIFSKNCTDEANKLKMLMLMEEKGIDLYRTGKDSHNILVEAAINHDKTTIRYLLEKKGFNINSVTKNGTTIFDMFTNDKQFLKYLFSKATITPDYKKLFYLSSFGNNPEVISYLIDSIKVIKVNDKYQGKPVIVNVRELKIADYLIKKGIDINEKDSEGMTALMVACSHFNLDLVKLYVNSKVDINAKDSYNWTALDWLLDYKNNSRVNDIIDYLIENGAVSGGVDKKERPVVWN